MQIRIAELRALIREGILQEANAYNMLNRIQDRVQKAMDMIEGKSGGPGYLSHGLQRLSKESQRSLQKAAKRLNQAHAELQEALEKERAHKTTAPTMRAAGRI